MSNSKKGFTLIEILIVVAIIAILASVVLVGLGPTQRQGRDARRISDLRQIQNALELYYNHCGWYPYSGGANCGTTWSSSDGSHTAFSAMSAAVIGTTGLGVSQIPEDPTNSANSSPAYQYLYGSASQSGYTLGAYLEDTSNAALKTSVVGASNNIANCGSSGLYCVTL